MAILIYKFNPTLNIWYDFSAGKLNKISEQHKDESEKERTRLSLGFTPIEKMSANLCGLDLLGLLYTCW